MDSFAIQDLISELTDLELAILLALICQEHCVIETPIVNVDNVAGELALVFYLPACQHLIILTHYRYVKINLVYPTLFSTAHLQHPQTSSAIAFLSLMREKAVCLIKYYLT
jgi:hypothetical protein